MRKPHVRLSRTHSRVWVVANGPECDHTLKRLAWRWCHHRNKAEGRKLNA